MKDKTLYWLEVFWKIPLAIILVVIQKTFKSISDLAEYLLKKL